MDNNITTNKSKNEAMDIQSILEKIKTLSISNDDKALLMKQFKYNIMNPSLSDNKDLETIHKKYLDTSQNPQQIQDTNFINTNPHHYNPQQYNPNQYTPNMPIQSNNLMTTAHFEILKNKIDTVQFELIDLLRHVKDYTQKYMTSVRQQDLEKIDEYVKGLFEVDKKIKETTEKSEMVPQTLEGEGEEPATEESVITRATSGIKNFMGNIGKNVSGITSLVKSTSDIANNYLSKNIITSPEEEKKPQTTTNSKINTNKNVVSIDEYIKSNENRLNNNTPIQEQKKKEAEIEEAKSEEEKEDKGNDNEEEEKEEEKQDKGNDNEEEEKEEEKQEEKEDTGNNEEEDTGNNEEEYTGNNEEENTGNNEDENTGNNEDEEEENTGNNEEEENTGNIEDEEEVVATTPDNLGNALNELNQKMKTDIDNTIVNTSNSNSDKTKIQQGGSFNSKLHTKLENNIKLLKLKLTKKKLLKKLTISNKKKLNKNKMSKHKLQKNKKNNKKTKHIK
jgi:hypothetical protein